MKKNCFLLTVIGLAIGFTFVNCSKKTEGGTADESVVTRTFKLGHNVNETNTWHLAAVKFAEEVKRRSDGKLEVVIYPNAQLGTEMDVVRSLQQGTADMTISGGALQNWAPLAALVETPYTFRDSEHVAKVANGEIGQKIAEQIIEKAKVRPLTYFVRGPRKLTANKEIQGPDDLQGFVIRVPASPLYVAAWEGLGAKPTPMAFSEVFTALQQGTINGQENPLAMIDTASFSEVQKYVMNTNHLISYIYLVMAEKVWQSMTQEEQVIFQEAAKVAHTYEDELFQQTESALATKLRDEGMTFVDVNYSLFRDKAMPAVIAKLSPEQKELYEQIVNID